MSNKIPFEIRVYAQSTPLMVEKVGVSYENGVTRLHIDAVATWQLGGDVPSNVVRPRIIRKAVKAVKKRDEIPVT